MERPLLVYTTFPDEATALAVGRELVAERLAACVNILPAMTSVYAWKGEIERGQEVVAIVKTREGLRDAVQDGLKARHPYETPIILFLEVAGGHPATLDWLFGETAGTAGGHPRQS
jgi:periplasmic divalent cation tolerance protein